MMPEDESGVIVVTIRRGIAGAVVEGFVAQPILGTASGGIIWSTIVAALGAIVLLTIYRLIVGSRASSG